MINPNRSYPLPPEQAMSNVAMDILYTLLTCGIYDLFWMRRQFTAVNAFLGREECNFGMWLLFCICTCGLYHVYYQYHFAQLINEVQRNRELPVNVNLAAISLMLTIFGLSIVADAIQQNEINLFYK